MTSFSIPLTVLVGVTAGLFLAGRADAAPGAPASLKVVLRPSGSKSSHARRIDSPIKKAFSRRANVADVTVTSDLLLIEANELGRTAIVVRYSDGREEVIDVLVAPTPPEELIEEWRVYAAGIEGVSVRERAGKVFVDCPRVDPKDVCRLEKALLQVPEIRGTCGRTLRRQKVSSPIR